MLTPERGCPSEGPGRATVDDPRAEARGLELRRLAAEGTEGWATACIESALEDPHLFVRAEASRALATAPDELVVPRLAEALMAREPAMRFRAFRLLLRRDPAAAASALDAAVRVGAPERRGAAVEALGRLGGVGLGTLLRLASSPEPALRARVAKALGATAEPEAAGALAALLDDPEPRVRRAAAAASSRVVDRPGATGAAELLAPRLARLAGSDDCPEVRRTALLAAARSGAAGSGDLGWALAEGGMPRVAALGLLARAGDVEALVTAATGPCPEAAREAAAALAGAEVPPEAARRLARREDEVVRLAALRTLGRHPTSPVARATLEEALEDHSAAVRWLARRCLEGRLGPAREAAHRERGPAEGPSARWPYGLPPPGEEARGARLPLAVGVVAPSYDLNLGVLIRSAEAAGASEVLVAGRDFHHVPAAMGADRWIPVTFLETWEALVVRARGLGYQIVAVQQSPGADRHDVADYPPRPCLLLGSEGPGLPPAACAAADLVVQVPLRGAIDSLNVASAGAIVLWRCLEKLGWLEVPAP